MSALGCRCQDHNTLLTEHSFNGQDTWPRSTHRTERKSLKKKRHLKRTYTCASTAFIQEAAKQALQTSPGLVPGLLVNTSVYILGLKVLLKGLTPAGVAHSWFLGTTIYSAFGLGGYLMVCLYFLLGSAVTKIKLEEKEAEGIAEKRSGRRSPGSVWGSGFAGMLCAIAALLFGQPDYFRIGFVASMVSKLSDTVSSEVGKAYGKTAYLITTFKRVPRGTEGAVSLEGTVAGFAAAAGFAALALSFKQVDARGAAIVTAAASFANLFESFLGAAVQGRIRWLSNDVVNSIQISLAAYVALFLVDL